MKQIDRTRVYGQPFNVNNDGTEYKMGYVNHIKIGLNLKKIFFNKNLKEIVKMVNMTS